MSEFLKSAQAVIDARNALSGDTQPDAPKKIFQLAGELCGLAIHPNRLFHWGEEAGSLIKLRNYCAVFLSNNDPKEKFLDVLEKHSNQAWLLGLQLAERAGSNLQSSAAAIVDKLQAVLAKIGKIIAKIIPQFRDDENVLYFILRHFSSFDACVKKGFARKIFQSLFKKGVSETERFLVGKYSSRGFKFLIPQIQKTLQQLTKA